MTRVSKRPPLEDEDEAQTLSISPLRLRITMGMLAAIAIAGHGRAPLWTTVTLAICFAAIPLILAASGHTVLLRSIVFLPTRSRRPRDDDAELDSGPDDDGVRVAQTRHRH